jgi:hypothetical protein
LPQAILDKIEFLCYKSPKGLEWSGVLLYSVEGSIEQYDTVKLKVEDIFLMDIGSAGGTEFELGEELVEYRMNNMESLSWKDGLIHSHHNMETYFSGTDKSELNDSSEFHNYYLSLIVNNRGDYTAKVAFRGSVAEYGCKNEKGEDWALKLANPRQVLFTFDCLITTPKDLIDVPKSFSSRLSAIAAESVKRKALVVQQYNKHLPKKKPFTKKYKQKPFPKFPKNKHHGNSFRDEELDQMDIDAWNESFGINKKPKKTPSDVIEDFALYILRLGEPLETDKLEDALEDTVILEEDLDQYVMKLVVMYPALFEKYWDVFGEINTDSFLMTTAALSDILEQYDGLFDIVEPLVAGLDLMVQKMEVLETE